MRNSFSSIRCGRISPSATSKMPSKSSTGATAGTERPSEPADRREARTGTADGSSVPPPSRHPGNLAVRFLSALVLGPSVLLAVWWGGAVFAAVTIAACLLAIDEWVRLVEPAHPPAARIAATAALVASFAVGL